MDLSERLRLINQARTKAPVDVHSLCKQMGIRVVEEELPEELVGKTRRAGNDFEIVVQASASYTRRRFMIAHALGHITLQPHRIEGEICENHSFQPGPHTEGSRFGKMEETTANQFAVTLLLPGETLRTEAEKEPDTAKLAEKFGVSKKAMEIRLDSLKTPHGEPCAP